jgi:tRNA modification GTPase
MNLDDTIVAPATPPGRGAVAIVRLSGPQAFAIADAMWRQQTPSRRARPRELMLGAIRDPVSGAALDRALCVRFPRPRSVTGEDVVELHCHGGPYLVRRLLAIAAERGARIAEPGEFSRRAYLNGRLDLTAAEAIADLIDARSESALTQAVAQLGGALGKRVEGLRARLIAIRAQLEAEIDFAEEDLEVASREMLIGQLDKIANDVLLLHDSYARGRAAREGLRVAIIGKPNVGKSSVLNLLLGTERAIVTALPGTTRDIIEDSLNLGPYALVMQDTAGVRNSGDEVERIGIDRALRSAADADLVLAVFDASRELDQDDARMIALTAGRSGVALLNKCDLPGVASPEQLRTGGLELPILDFSAVTGAGLAALHDALLNLIERLTDRGEPRGDGVAISRERHRAALAQSLEALNSARGSLSASLPAELVAIDLTIASGALAALTGTISSEDILDAVFREFCIGK